jgi:hypothetical protein
MIILILIYFISLFGCFPIFFKEFKLLKNVTPKELIKPIIKICFPLINTYMLFCIIKVYVKYYWKKL